MRKQRGMTLMEVMVVVAILGIIAAIVVPTIHHWFGLEPSGNETATTKAIYEELRGRPISSLNVTELQFVVDYATNLALGSGDRSTIAIIYQNQIIITKLDELLQTEVAHGG